MKKIVRGFSLFSVLAIIAAAANAAAPVPSPEKLLPGDTLFMVTVPDFAKGRDIYKSSPQVQFWNDAAMKPFRDKFMEHWTGEFLKPLERELNVKFSDYADLPQGQLTFAIVQNGWQGKADVLPSMLLLLDVKMKSDQLKTNLADLKKKWVDAGKKIRTEKIRAVDFSVVAFSGNELPRLLKKAIPGPPSEEAADPENKDKPKREIFVGQMDSLLIVSDSAKTIEKLLSRLTGGTVPSLGELASYQSAHNSLFRESPFYGWVNVKAFTDIFSKPSGEENEPESVGGFNMKPEKVIAATGLAGLKTAAFSLNTSSEGTTANFFLAAPESGRAGILKILAGEAKETSAPAFVPADAVKFQRVRVDGQKAWATLEKMLNDINPQIMGGINFLLDTATAGAKDKDPDFDLKKSFIGNLGDDIVSYEKNPRASNTAADLNTAPSIMLISSPKPEQLAVAFKGLLVFFPSNQQNPPKEREFLGRKIYSTPLPSLPMGSASNPGDARSLNYAASGGYLAISTDVAMLEEFLRSSENPPKALRETAGLAAAAQKVTGPGTSWFGFENQNETMRVLLEVVKKDPALFMNKFSPIPGMAAGGTDKEAKPWIDATLLPTFDKVSKYFYFSVYGISANVEGISMKFFAPVPPQLKKTADSPGK